MYQSFHMSNSVTVSKNFICFFLLYMQHQQQKPCFRCVDLFDDINARVRVAEAQYIGLQNIVDDLQHERNYYKSKYEEVQNQYDFAWEDVPHEYKDTSPSQLHLSQFFEYLTNLMQQYPIITFILNLFLSQSHKHKLNATSTNPK